MVGGRVERRLSAIFAADMVGYSRLMEADEARTIARQKSHRAELIDPEIAQHQGRIVKTTGDGLLAEFASVVDAVACAVTIQRTMLDREAAVPEEQRIQYRVGINLGDIVVDGDDIYGDGVNIAARLQELADPGGLSIPQKVFEEVRTKIDVGFEFLGEQSVKNIERPIPVYRVLLDPEAAGTVIGGTPGRSRLWQQPALAVLGVFLLAIGGLAIWNSYRQPREEPASIERMAFPLPEMPSVAVLPFDNLSDDPQMEYFANGLSEDIITSLARLPNIFVIARNSSFTYKGKAVKVQQVAQELGVKYVLEGSVQKSGDHLRITSQLIDALTGGHVWAESYDREVTEFFAIKDDITLNILTNLEVELTAGENTRVRRRDTDNLQAWLLYREASEHFGRSTKEDNRRARELIEAAIELDPAYSAAYSRLSSILSLDARQRWVDDPKGAVAKAEEFARRAVQLDPTNSSAYGGLSTLHLYRREHDDALAASERAVFLAPNDSRTARVYGFVLQKANYAEKSIQQLEKALRLDPFAPAWVVESLCESYVMVGRYEDAIMLCQKALQLQPAGPGAADAHLDLAIANDALGRDDDAREEIRRAIEVYPAFTLGNLSKWQVYRDKEYQAQWLDKLRRLGLPE